MNNYIVSIFSGVILAPLIAAAGQVDPRFEGVWVGTESYGIFNTATQAGQSTRPEQAVIVIDPAGMQFGVLAGLGPGKYKLKTRSGGNKIWFEDTRSGTGRNKTTFVLSADGNTITETGFGLYPCLPYSCECEIKATLHRRGKK
jgi:hypothetical protein